MRRITPFSPSFGQVSTNRTRRPAYLVDQRKSFIRRKRFRKFENFQRGIECSLINPQFPNSSDIFSHPFSLPSSILFVPTSPYLRVAKYHTPCTSGPQKYLWS